MRTPLLFALFIALATFHAPARAATNAYPACQTASYGPTQRQWYAQAESYMEMIAWFNGEGIMISSGLTASAMSQVCDVDVYNKLFDRLRCHNLSSSRDDLCVVCASVLCPFLHSIMIPSSSSEEGTSNAVPCLSVLQSVVYVNAPFLLSFYFRSVVFDLQHRTWIMVLNGLAYMYHAPTMPWFFNAMDDYPGIANTMPYASLCFCPLTHTFLNSHIGNR